MKTRRRRTDLTAPTPWSLIASAIRTTFQIGFLAMTGVTALCLVRAAWFFGSLI